MEAKRGSCSATVDRAPACRPSARIAGPTAASRRFSRMLCNVLLPASATSPLCTRSRIGAVKVRLHAACRKTVRRGIPVFGRPASAHPRVTRPPGRRPSPAAADGRDLQLNAAPSSCRSEWPPATAAGAAIIEGLSFPSIRQFRARHRPRCQGASPSTPASHVQAAVARRTCSWCAGKSTSPSFSHGVRPVVLPDQRHRLLSQLACAVHRAAQRHDRQRLRRAAALEQWSRQSQRRAWTTGSGEARTLFVER